MNEDKGQREHIHQIFRDIGNQMNNGNEKKVEKDSMVIGGDDAINQNRELQKQSRCGGCGRGIQ